jgi:membrane protein
LVVGSQGWKDVLTRTLAEVKRNRATLLAAGVAFYALLALVPALVALVSIYGLVADPASVDRQVSDWLGAAPREVRDLLSSQLQSITSNAGAAAGIGAVIGIIVALWTASSGMAHLMEAINAAYDEAETRSFVQRRGLALAFTVGAIAFILVAVGAITVLPALLADTGLGAAGRITAGVARWILLLVGMMLALAVLYRYAPDRDEPRWSWTTPGALVATLVWLVASAVFAIYAGNFGKYNETYGSLGAVVVLMLWLFITALAVVLGAELNAALERQTLEDSTAGQPRALGEGGATAADAVGATFDEIREGDGCDPTITPPE